MSKINSRLIRFFVSALAVTAFLVLSSVAVVWANGLKFNPKTGNFQRTVLVAVETEMIKEAKIYLNGELIGFQSPIRVRGLLPGIYNLEIHKDGYHSWRQSFNLAAGQIGVVKAPVLIAKNPKVEVDPMGEIIEPTRQFDLGLSLVGGELYDRGTFITRFAKEPTAVFRYNGWYIYRIDNVLRAYTKEGPHDILLYEAKDAVAFRFEMMSNWRFRFQENKQGVLTYFYLISETAAN